MLLLRGRAPQVPLKHIVLDRRRQHAGGVFGVGLAINLEGFLEGVGGVIGLVQVLGLDGGGFFEGETGFLVCFDTTVRLGTGDWTGGCPSA